MSSSGCILNIASMRLCEAITVWPHYLVRMNYITYAEFEITGQIVDKLWRKKSMDPMFWMGFWGTQGVLIALVADMIAIVLGIVGIATLIAIIVRIPGFLGGLTRIEPYQKPGC